MGQEPALVRGPVSELHDLMAVQAFYLSLLQEQIGHEIPVPSEVQHSAAAAGQDLGGLQRWLSLLDLAITPLCCATPSRVPPRGPRRRR